MDNICYSGGSTYWQDNNTPKALFLMTTKDLDDNLLNMFKECPYKGKREDCTFPEMREMEIGDRSKFFDEMDDDEKVARWQKHLQCLMNALAK
jgi:hypothetical protein